MSNEEPFPQLYPTINDNEDDPEMNSCALSIKGKDMNEVLNFNEPKMVEFLRVITKSSTGLSNEYLSFISKFIRHSKLIQRAEADYKSDKRLSLSSFCGLCANLLQFHELKKGEILFRIHDIGDKCFFLLRGKLSVLKLKHISGIQMSAEQYLNYLQYLKEKEEIYILNEVIRKNFQQFPIDSLDDIATLQRLLFLMMIRSAIDQERLTLEELIALFKKHKKTFDEFGIDTEMISLLWYNKTQHYINADYEWKHFLNKKFELKTHEIIFFNRYNFLLVDTIKEWTGICYESFLYLGNGSFFGDTALDSLDKRRNASIRAETDTIVASLSDADYAKLIAPKNKKEKQGLMSYLYDNFFFKSISSYSFEKIYFHQFAPHEYYQHYILYKSGVIPKELIFLKEGKVEVNMKCSVFDLHHSIKQLIEQISSLPCFTQGFNSNPAIISKEAIFDLKELVKDCIPNKLLSKSKAFQQTMNKMHTFQLFILTGKDLIGIEEIILNRPFMTIGKVMTAKASFFKLDVNKLAKLLEDEKSTRYSYTKFAANKLISLIERLHHLKKNCIDLTLNKIKHEELTRKLMLNEEKSSLKEYDVSQPKQISIKENICKDLFRKRIDRHLEQHDEHHPLKKNRCVSQKLFHKDKNKENDKKIKPTDAQVNQLNANLIHSIVNSQNNVSSSEKNKERLTKRTYVDYKNRYLSSSILQKELVDFSSIESQNVILKVVAKPPKHKAKGNTPKHMYKSNSQNRLNEDSYYQSVTVNELSNSQFNMSFVNLLNIKEGNYDSLNTSIKFKSKGSENCIELPKLVHPPEKMPFITQLKRTANNSKSPTQHNLLRGTKQDNKQGARINMCMLNLKDSGISKSQPDLMSGIVKDFYQRRRKCGYSVIINNPNNSYLRMNNQMNSSNNPHRREQKMTKSSQGGN